MLLPFMKGSRILGNHTIRVRLTSIALVITLKQRRRRAMINVDLKPFIIYTEDDTILLLVSLV